MWKFLRYLAYQPLILVLFIVGTAFGGKVVGGGDSVFVGMALAIAVPLVIEFTVRRFEKRNA